MDLQKTINNLASCGYDILEDVIDGDQCDRYIEEIKAVIDINADVASPDGILNLVPSLGRLCDNPGILQIFDVMLGNDVCLASGLAVKSSKPGFPGGGLHSDVDMSELSKYDDIPFWHTIQVLWALHDTTEYNGCTQIVPYSHHTRANPAEYGFDTNPCPHAVPVPLKRGSAIIAHAAVWHRGSANHSTDQPRLMISGYFTLPALYDRIISCRGFWPAIRPSIHKQFSLSLQNMTSLATIPKRGNRKE